MKKTEDYLTEEELNRLIMQVEAGDMAAAPPDMAQTILDRLDEEEKQNQKTVPAGKEKAVIVKLQRDRQKEYRMYCIRVMTSVAAAILLLFMVPQLWSYRSTVDTDNAVFGIGRIETKDKESESVQDREKTETSKPESSLFGIIGEAHYLSDQESHVIFREK